MERSRTSIEKIRPVLEAIEKSIDRLRHNREEVGFRTNADQSHRGTIGSVGMNSNMKARAKRPSVFLRPISDSEQDRLIG